MMIYSFIRRLNISSSSKQLQNAINQIDIKKGFNLVCIVFVCCQLPTNCRGEKHSKNQRKNIFQLAYMFILLSVFIPRKNKTFYVAQDNKNFQIQPLKYVLLLAHIQRKPSSAFVILLACVEREENLLIIRENFPTTRQKNSRLNF